jgi:hypothetical protein
VEPKEDDVDPSTLKQTGDSNIGGPKYGGTNGYQRYRDDLAAFRQVKESKKKLLSLLLSKISDEVLDKVQSDPGYEQARKETDILKIWQIVEKVSLGTGAVAVHQRATKLINSRQRDDTIDKYSREFSENVRNLLSQGKEDEILKVLFNTLYIRGLNQVQFKEKLNEPPSGLITIS